MPLYVIGEILPKNNADFPIVDDSNVRGGHRSVSSIGDMNAITQSHRKIGMTVYVVSNNKTYKLLSDLITWEEVQLGNGSGGSTPTDLIFVHQQQTPLSIWQIDHNLSKIPSIVVTDTLGTEVYGEYVHNTVNRSTLNFGYPITGIATFN